MNIQYIGTSDCWFCEEKTPERICHGCVHDMDPHNHFNLFIFVRDKYSTITHVI